MSLHSIYNRLFEAVNYRLPKIAGGRFVSYCRPINVIFLLTKICNARCVHCDIWKSSGPEDNPSIDQLKGCLRELRQWLGPRNVTFTGGEALIKPYTVELLEYAVGLGLRPELLTNGFWSDQEKIKRVALTDPWRITVSFDGFGNTHDNIRGRENFYATTAATLRTLCDVRRQNKLSFQILLKTVIMEHNVGELSEIAKFAASEGIEVRYQPIEQNYATEEDPEWFLHSQNWPRDITTARSAVSELIVLKRQGFPIANSVEELEEVIRYFEHPAELQVLVQSHVPSDEPKLCAANSDLQIQPNGDVNICARRPAIGNIKQRSLREIWRNRPPYWKNCCIHDKRN